MVKSSSVTTRKLWGVQHEATEPDKKPEAGRLGHDVVYQTLRGKQWVLEILFYYMFFGLSWHLALRYSSLRRHP